LNRWGGWTLTLYSRFPEQRRIALKLGSTQPRLKFLIRWGDGTTTSKRTLGFVNAVANWSDSQGYQLLVTGHSLGGILTEFTAASLEDAGIAQNAYFVTFASPGSPEKVDSYAGRILNFVRTNDPVPRIDNLLISREGTTVSIIPNLDLSVPLGSLSSLTTHDMKREVFSIDSRLRCQIRGQFGHWS
jgi:hypothetical protein